jgi:hypothetical protein
MKIEKVSFKNIKDILSRDEMKQIVAGCGSSAYCGGRCASNNGACYRPFDERIYQCICTATGQASGCIG